MERGAGGCFEELSITFSMAEMMGSCESKGR